jgi:YHS domain-containing protein
MKRILFFVLTAIICSCSQKPKEPEVLTAPALMQSAQKDTNKTAAKIVLAMNNDPVCGMPVAEDYNDTTLYNGKIYGFCSTDCKTEFLKNPKEYLKN